MSAKNRNGPSRELGYYATPSWVTDGAIDMLIGTEPVIPAHKWPRRILEPMAGTGAIVRQLIARGCPAERIKVMEIDRGRAAELARIPGLRGAFYADVFDAYVNAMHEPAPFDLIITNPDFAQMSNLVRHVLVHRDWLAPGGTLALLGPLNYLAPADGRGELHAAFPPDVHHLPRRPSFCAAVTCGARCGWRVLLDPEEPRPKTCEKCGTKVTITTSDAMNYAWFMWVRGSMNKTSRNFWLKERAER